MKLSQETIAARSTGVDGGISRLAITKIETGLRRLTYLSRLKIAAGMGLTIEELNFVLDGIVEPDVMAARVRARS